jgi:hypothetical protein
LARLLQRIERVVSGGKTAKTPANPTRSSKDKLMNILPGNMRFGAGQPVKRLEDQRLLTGRGQFIDDKPDEGALWLYVLRSPHAHARIVSIDTGLAAGMPGVHPGVDLLRHDVLLVFGAPCQLHLTMKSVVSRRWAVSFLF